MKNVFQRIVNKKLIQSNGFINGKFTPGFSQSSFNVLNPANGEVIAELPSMGVKDAEEAIRASKVSFESWKNTSGKERASILSNMHKLMVEHRDDLASIITLESGKPFKEAQGEIGYAASFYELYSEEAKRIQGEVLTPPNNGRRLLAIRQPVGPAALITPWNFPAAMITRKVGPALAAGCSVVIKPAEDTPLSALALCAIAEEAGVPAGVVNCLTVDRSEVVDVGTLLCHSRDIRKISFTGSTNVGKWLMRESASTVKRISLELGGNAPFIVFDDADLDVALSALMSSKYRNAGQACIASNRVLVQDAVYDKFAVMVAEEAKKMVCGNGFDPAYNIGPLINKAGLDKVAEHVHDCVSKGGKVLSGGSFNNALNENGGLFYNPTVIANATREMLPFNAETFGPLVPLLRFKTESEAVAIANDTPYGLAAYACTRDLARAWRMAEQLDAGMVGINEGAISGDNTPFGGVKESGVGREGGPYGLQEYLEVKYVCMGLGK